MKRGATFGAFSDSRPDRDDSSVKHKSTMPSNSFNAHGGLSIPKVMSTPTVDPQRAKLAHKHVTALNKQFASWVQSQLLNHPDELWKDGVNDYLAHATSIMERFSDVVAWLEANSVEARQSKDPIVPTSKPNSLGGMKSNGLPTLQPQNGTVPQSCTTSAAQNTWAGNLFSSRQDSVLQGNQSSTPTNLETAIDPDEESEVNEPSSPSVKKVEEQGVLVVHEVKCKVYVKPDNPADKAWRDIGMGMLSIKCKEGVAKATKESKPTIIIRNDVGKPLLNALIYHGIKLNIQKKAIASIFHTANPIDANGENGNGDASVARTFLLRLKTEEDTEKLAAAIQEYAPST